MTTSTTTTETHGGVTYRITTTTTTRRRQAAMPRSEAEWDEIRKRRDAFRRLNGDRDDEAERRRQAKMGAWIRRRARAGHRAAPTPAPCREVVGIASRSRSGRAPHRQASRALSSGGADLPSSDDPDPPPKEKAPWPGAFSKYDDAPRIAESGARLNVAGSARAWARRAGGVERLRDRGRP